VDIHATELPVSTAHPSPAPTNPSLPNRRFDPVRHPDDPSNYARVHNGFFLTDVAISTFERVQRELRHRKEGLARRRTEEAEREARERKERWEQHVADAEAKGMNMRKGAHLPLGDSRTSPDYYTFNEVLNTPELTIEQWRATYNPDTMPDDFEAPEEPDQQPRSWRHRYET
jgi:hypothetical protein